MLSSKELLFDDGPKQIKNSSSKREEFSSFLLSSAETLPELAYISFVLTNDVTRESLLGEGGSLPATTSSEIAVAWNYADGVCAMITGISQLTDKDNYRQKSTIAKGIINILNGTQLLALSNNYSLFSYGLEALTGASSLAGPAFVLAMLCDVITLTIDLHNAAQELEFEGWLDERIQEVEFLQKRMAEEREKLNALNDEDSADYQKKLIKIIALENKEKKLLADMGSRCRYHCNSENQDSWKEIISNKLINKPTVLERHQGINLDYFTRKWQSDSENSADTRKNAAIQSDVDKHYKQTRLNLAFKVLSFIGMTLAAVSPFVACPPLALAATIICSGVAAYNVYKNGCKAYQFFKPACVKHKQEEEFTCDVDEVSNLRAVA
ncbi:MAG: hypothetical protein ABI597_07795 [Gammaproteobacteria bacterium]